MDEDQVALGGEHLVISIDCEHAIEGELFAIIV